MSDNEERTSDLSSDEEVDPRVQDELESLNSASQEINKLERELERARTKFRSLMTDSTLKLNQLYKKLGKCVQKSKPYYDLCKDSRRSQAEAQKAAVKYSRASGMYQTAKEMVSLAEEKIVNEMGKGNFDTASQEALNNATEKFMESDVEKQKSEVEHMVKAAEYAAMQQKLHYYDKDRPRTIMKARPYFELKERLEHNLMAERQTLEDLSRALDIMKARYKEALGNLESISEEVHARRRHRLCLPPRTPGVGAESNSDQSDLPSINLDILSETSSQVSYDEFDDKLSPSSDTGFDSDTLSLNSETSLEPPFHSDITKPSARVMPMVRNSPTSHLPQAFKSLNMHDNLRRNYSDPSSMALRFKPQHPQHAAMGAAPIATAVSASQFTAAFDVKGQEADAKGQRSREQSDEERRRQKQQRRLESQKAFPILIGLSETNKSLSPRLGRAILDSHRANTTAYNQLSASPPHSPLLHHRVHSRSSLTGSPQHGMAGPLTQAPPLHASGTKPLGVDHRSSSPVNKNTTTFISDKTNMDTKTRNALPAASARPKAEATNAQPPQLVAKVLPQRQLPSDQYPRKQLPNEPFPRYQLPQQTVHPLTAEPNGPGLFETVPQSLQKLVADDSKPHELTRPSHGEERASEMVAN